MKTGIWPAIVAGALLSLSAAAQTPEVTLTRIECGTGAKPTIVAERFSDTFAYKPDLALTFTFSCYLIKHGDEYMVWDTGFAPGSNPNAPKGRHRRAPRRGEGEAGAGEIRRHQPLPRRPHRPARAVRRRDAAHRQGRLGRRHGNPADAGRERRGFKDWMGANARKVEPLTLDKTFSATARLW